MAKNPQQALFWACKAAAQGHADGQFWLGNAYRRDLGVEFDVDQARYWLRKSPRRGTRTRRGWTRSIAPPAAQSQSARREPAGHSLWRQYSETMERQRRENCAAAAQGRSRVCTPY